MPPQPPIPFILYGDGPRLRSGLARIARDLAMRLKAEEESLGIRLLQLGVDYPAGWHWQPWDFYGFQPSQEDQGWAPLKLIEQELQEQGAPKPIVLAIMDPGRVYDLVRWHDDGRFVDGGYARSEVWGYFPVDSYNIQQRIGGPAAQAVLSMDRLLAYGQFGADVLRRTLLAELPEQSVGPVSYLPHGLEPGAFQPGVSLADAHPDFRRWAATWDHTQAVKVGCVATNQFRKDLGLLFASVAELKTRGAEVALWLHTDAVTKAWDVGELASSFGFERHEVAVSTAELSDRQLSAQYSWSDVTLAPGLGEGFGYPIVESLACGTPVVHGDYGGGAELLPTPSWLVTPAAWRLDGLYAVQRPVFKPTAVAQALGWAAEWKREDSRACTAYCSGAVAHLSWEHLWPRWRSWIQRGLKARHVSASVVAEATRLAEEV